MKNVFVLPTDKPSRLSKDENDRIWLSINFEYGINDNNKQNIYITSDEEIKEGDRFFTSDHNGEGFRKYKIILTTDQDLIDLGVQSIDDEFLQWYIKNPSCEEVEVIPYLKDIINPLTNEKFPAVQHRHFDETKMIFRYHYKIIIPKEEPKQEQDRNKFSKEDMEQAFIAGVDKESYNGVNFDVWFEQFKNKL